jgi:hypothetical protein
MSFNIQFVPTSYFSSKGYLEVPGHRGSLPICSRESTLGLFSPKENGRNILLTVQNESRELPVSVDIQELVNKLLLSNEDLYTIRNERNLASRTNILSSIVQKKLRGRSLQELCSPLNCNLREQDLIKFLDDMQNIFNLGPLFLEDLTKSFESLWKEYCVSPYDTFFPIAHKLLEKISKEENKTNLKKSLEKISISLHSPSLLSEGRTNSPELTTLKHTALAALNAANSTYRERPTLPSTSIASSPLTTTPLVTGTVQKNFLSWFASDDEIISYLGLDEWSSDGNKAEALRKIIECFREKNHTLDLSRLNLTSLPNNLKFEFVKHINLSQNKITDISMLSQFIRIETLDLSYNNFSERDGIQNFLPLKRLENLRSIKLLHMSGDRKLLKEKIKTELEHCETIEWVDERNSHLTFSRRPGELLGNFLNRRNAEFSSTSAPANRRTLRVVPHSNPLSLLQEHINEGPLKSLNISSLTSKDANIIPWLTRIVGQDAYTSLNLWENVALRPDLSKKVLEVLHEANRNPKFFKDILTPLISESLLDCGDRTLYFLNEIIRRMELIKTEDLPTQEALLVFKKYFSVSIIKEIARDSIQQRAEGLPINQRELLEGEELEVVLDLLIRFKAPLAFSKGRFTDLEKETREKFLNDSSIKLTSTLKSEDEWINYLASDPDWKERLLNQTPSLKSKLKTLKESTRDPQVESLEMDKDNISSAEYLRVYAEIRKSYEALELSIFREETLNALKSI